MARPRKNAAKVQDTLLTPDESAIIPVEEQPYPLPEGWKWVYLKNGYEVTSSKRIHKSDWRDSGIPFYRTRELVKLSNYGLVDNELFIDEEFYKLIKLKFGVPQANDILISGVGTIGVPYIVSDNSKFYFKDGNIIWLKNKNIFLPKFVFYLFKSPFIKKQIHEMSAGTTVDTYTIVNANKTKLPLPPLKVQQRIVDRIESLFAKLDEAREKAEAVLDGFESRKAAILHKAFTGELTAKWREEKGVKKESWQKMAVGEVCHDVKVGIVIKPSQYYIDSTKGTPAFRSANVRENRIDNFDWVYLSSEGMTANKRSIVYTGDVLVVRSGNPGTACVVTEEFDGYNAIDILIAVPDQSKVTSQYLCSFTNSPLGKKSVAASKRGLALAHFNVKSYSALSLDLPSLPEQQEITRILDSLLVKEQKAKEAAESVLEHIDLMKKAILAKAFRGELTGPVI